MCLTKKYNINLRNNLKFYLFKNKKTKDGRVRRRQANIRTKPQLNRPDDE